MLPWCMKRLYTCNSPEHTCWKQCHGCSYTAQHKTVKDWEQKVKIFFFFFFYIYCRNYKKYIVAWPLVLVLYQIKKIMSILTSMPNKTPFRWFSIGNFDNKYTVIGILKRNKRFHSLPVSSQALNYIYKCHGLVFFCSIIWGKR